MNRCRINVMTKKWITTNLSRIDRFGLYLFVDTQNMVGGSIQKDTAQLLFCVSKRVFRFIRKPIIIIGIGVMPNFIGFLQDTSWYIFRPSQFVCRMSIWEFCNILSGKAEQQSYEVLKPFIFVDVSFHCLWKSY